MPTQQKLNVLTIHNSDYDRPAARVCFAGRVELSTREIAIFLRWLKSGPVAGNTIVSFGDNTSGTHAVTGDRVFFGELDHHVAHEDALTLVNQAMVLSASKEQKTQSRDQKGGAHV